MNDYEIWSNELKIERTIKALEENNMNGYYAKTREDLIDKIKELVDEGAIVLVEVQKLYLRQVL